MLTKPAARSRGVCQDSEEVQAEDSVMRAGGPAVRLALDVPGHRRAAMDVCHLLLRSSVWVSTGKATDEDTAVYGRLPPFTVTRDGSLV